jgi:hypothetical protein
VLVWGSDSPHHEGTWPKTGRKLHELFDGVPIEDARAILGDNFLRAYPLDRARLSAIAERIGPHPADLGLRAPSDR